MTTKDLIGFLKKADKGGLAEVKVQYVADVGCGNMDFSAAIDSIEVDFSDGAVTAVRLASHE